MCLVPLVMHHHLQSYSKSRDQALIAMDEAGNTLRCKDTLTEKLERWLARECPDVVRIRFLPCSHCCPSAANLPCCMQSVRGIKVGELHLISAHSGSGRWGSRLRRVPQAGPDWVALRAKRRRLCARKYQGCLQQTEQRHESA